MKIALSILIILIALGALWLQIGLFALVVAPALGFFLVLALAPVALDALEHEASRPAAKRTAVANGS